MSKQRCRACQRLYSHSEMVTVPHHTQGCTEEVRLAYYARFANPVPPRQDDPCAGVTLLCRKCTARLRPEEQLKFYLDLLQKWTFVTDAGRIRTEVEIATRVLSGVEVAT